MKVADELTPERAPADAPRPEELDVTDLVDGAASKRELGCAAEQR
jgi:hypothetical protein